jgi:hypothetical protein
MKALGKSSDEIVTTIKDLNPAQKRLFLFIRDNTNTTITPTQIANQYGYVREFEDINPKTQEFIKGFEAEVKLRKAKSHKYTSRKTKGCGCK